MAGINGQGFITSADLYSTTASPGDGMPVGGIAWDGKSGKSFRYTLAGGSTLVVGNLLQSAANDTTYTNVAVQAAAAAGDRQISLVNGTATITSEQFLGGSLSTYTAGTIGIGDEYTIVGITGTLTTGGTILVSLDRPLRAAVTTSATVNLRRSPWNGTIQFPATTQTGIPVGVAVYPITNAQYGWVQTHGIAAVLSDGSTFAIGSDVGTPSGTAGAVTVSAPATAHARVGIAQQLASSGHAINILLQID